MSQKKRVVIIGSGNWGSTIAKIVGRNAAKYPLFENEVRMYVHERMVDGHKLSKIINTQHENVKCLPGHKLPLNIVADPDVVHAAADADILIFVVPHVFVARLCTQLKGTVKPGAIGITLIKGFGELPNGEIEVISDVIRKSLGIEVAVLMGANIAHEVAEEQFCETTLGSNCAKSGKILKSLFQTEYFRVRIVPDAYTVEVCGALKNIVACAAGFADGLGHNNNTKAALIRIGFTEMIRFCRTYFAEGLQITTFLESCGVADLITTCYGGRNRLVSEAFVKSGKSIEVLEKELLNGQKLQGYQTCDEVVKMLKVYGHADKFPLFVTVDMIYKGQLPAAQLVERVRMEIVDAQSVSISL